MAPKKINFKEHGLKEALKVAVQAEIAASRFKHAGEEHHEKEEADKAKDDANAEASKSRTTKPAIAKDLATIIGKADGGFAGAKLGGMDLANIARMNKQRTAKDVGVRYSLTEDMTESLAKNEDDQIIGAYHRYDGDRSGFLNASELRMALRELGYNTPLAVVKKWAEAGKDRHGLTLAELRKLVASGKLGPKAIREVMGMDRQDFVQKLRTQAKDVQTLMNQRRGAMAADNRQGRGDQDIALPGMKARQAPRLDGKANMMEQVSVARRREIHECFAKFDRDKSGFLEVREFRDALNGLGFQFDDVTVVRTCNKYGGVISKEAWQAIASTQINYRDELLEVHNMLVGDYYEDDEVGESLDQEDSMDNFMSEEGGHGTKKSLGKAYLHMKASAATDKANQWRSLLTTSHGNIGEHSIGMRLYFDLLVVMIAGFAVLAVMNMDLLVACSGSDAHVIILTWTGSNLARLAEVTVGNLPRLDEAKGVSYAAQDATAISVLSGILVLYAAIWIPRAIKLQAKAGRLEDLAIKVDHLPKDLGDAHEEYAELLEDHFNDLALEDYGDDDDVPEKAVQEVVIARQYYGAVKGVLKQVRMLKKERAIDARLSILRAQQARLKTELGLNKDDAKDRAEDLEFGDEELDAPAPLLEGSAPPKRKMRRLNKIEEDIVRYGHKREEVQEKMLEIETARGNHSDMRPKEREVLSAWVVFWSGAQRDTILSKYRCSARKCCRRCQRKELRFGPPNDKSDSDDPFDDTDSDDDKVPLKVSLARDPSLILWENLDLPRWKRKLLRFRTRIMIVVAWGISIGISYACHAYRLSVPLKLSNKFDVYIVANMTSPDVTGTHGWKACELEVFSDAACSARVYPQAYVSSNGLDQWQDSGLRFLKDRNLQASSMCHGAWQNSRYWQPLLTAGLKSSCAVASTGGRRLSETKPPARGEIVTELEEEAEPADDAVASRLHILSDQSAHSPQDYKDHRKSSSSQTSLSEESHADAVFPDVSSGMSSDKKHLSHGSGQNTTRKAKDESREAAAKQSHVQRKENASGVIDGHWIRFVSASNDNRPQNSLLDVDEGEREDLGSVPADSNGKQNGHAKHVESLWQSLEMPWASRLGRSSEAFRPSPSQDAERTRIEPSPSLDAKHEDPNQHVLVNQFFSDSTDLKHNETLSSAVLDSAKDKDLFEAATATTNRQEDLRPIRIDDFDWASWSGVRNMTAHQSQADRRLTQCYWTTSLAGNMNNSVVTIRIFYQHEPDPYLGESHVMTGLTQMLDSMLVPDAPTFQYTFLTPHVFSVSGMASAPAITPVTTCIDQADAPAKLIAILGLKGDEVRTLNSCYDFAIMGLLGVKNLGVGNGRPEYCTLLPQNYRCLCAVTCSCPCASNGGSCDCTAPDPLTDNVLPLQDGYTGIVRTMEFHGELCITTGNSLVRTSCEPSDILATGELSLSPKETYFENLNIWATGALVDAPDQRTCTPNQGPKCYSGHVQCKSRQNLLICAVRCNGIEECEDGMDELRCRDSVCAPANTCTYPPGRCIDANTAAQGCVDCATTSTNEIQCKIPTSTAGATTPTPAQCIPSVLHAHFASNAACDPAKDGYDPCACLSPLTTAAQRTDFACLVRGDINAAWAAYGGLQALYHFELVASRRVTDGTTGGRDLECKNAAGDSAQCAVEDDGVLGKTLKLRGDVWMISTGNFFAATSLHSFVMFVKASCTSCIIAQTDGDGAIFIDGDGYLAVTVGSSEWKPKAGALLNDGSWHFVGHSIGNIHGEILVVDQTVVGNRTFSDALSAGWAAKSSRVVVGFQIGSTMSPLSGWVDEAAVYANEMPHTVMMHIAIAGSWRQAGPTFADRFLSFPCQDKGFSTARADCDSAKLDLLLQARDCVQGNACGCLDALMPTHREALSCKVQCDGSTATMTRTVLGILREKCGDQSYYAESCYNSDDCFIKYPPDTGVKSDGKFECDSSRGVCTVKSTQRADYHTGRVKFCIGYSSQYFPTGLTKYQAILLVAGWAQMNTSNITDAHISDGCEGITTWNPYVILAQNGTGAISIPLFSLQPSVGHNTADSKLRIGADGSVTHAGGFQTIIMDFTQITGTTSFASKKTAIYPTMPNIRNRYVSYSNVPMAASQADVGVGIPPSPTYGTAPTPNTVTDTGIVVLSQVTADVKLEVLEVCKATEFECSPGVCIACSAFACVCNGWNDCPNGEDEDAVYVIGQGKSCGIGYVNLTAVPCGGGEGLYCRNASRDFCVPTARVCDGVNDCPDGIDERDCPTKIDPTVAHTWIGFMFNEPTQIGCVRTTQAAVFPAQTTKLFACKRGTVIHPATSSPMRNPVTACVPMQSSTISNSSAKNPSSKPIWEQYMSFEMDHIASTYMPSGDGQECALGLALNPSNALGLAAAQLERDTESMITKCFCEQRVQLEPAVYMSLTSDDFRYKLCEDTLWRIELNEMLVYIRAAAIMFVDEIYRLGVHYWASHQRHPDHTAHLQSHFWLLTWGLLANTAAFPLFMSCDLPMREWHGVVGTTMTIMMIVRVFYPNIIPLLWMLVHYIKRRYKRNSCLTQEMLNELYTLPEFPLAESFSEITVTSVIALVYGPAMPLLNWLALFSLMVQYVTARVVFLRGSLRPPAYDDVIARDCLMYITLAVAIHCVSAAVTFTDQAIFPSTGADCGGTGAVKNLSPNTQDADDGPNGIMIYKLASPGNIFSCSAVAVSFFIPLIAAGTTLVLLPVMPFVVRKCKKYCRRGEGSSYDDLKLVRDKYNLVATYEPTEQTRYRSAFKLVDLAATYNEDAHAFDESSEESSSEDDTDVDSTDDDEDDERGEALMRAANMLQPQDRNEQVAREEQMLARLAAENLIPTPSNPKPKIAAGAMPRPPPEPVAVKKPPVKSNAIAPAKDVEKKPRMSLASKAPTNERKKKEGENKTNKRKEDELPQTDVGAKDEPLDRDSGRSEAAPKPERERRRRRDKEGPDAEKKPRDRDRDANKKEGEELGKPAVPDRPERERRARPRVGTEDGKEGASVTRKRREKM